MNKVVQHVGEAIRFENTLALEPVFDPENSIRSTGGMRTWYTGRPCERTRRSHINFCVFDSTWEATEAFELDRNDLADAWVKDDHLGFEILYVFRGVVKKYWPDYLIRLKSGRMLVLEVKGQDSQEDQTKREFLDEWVRAVNGHGGFGKWSWAVSRHPKDVLEILAPAREAPSQPRRFRPEPVRWNADSDKVYLIRMIDLGWSNEYAPRMSAGSLLRYARGKAGLSQRQLGRRAGVSQTTISQIEDDKTSPRFETLDRLVAACGFELELLPRAGIGIDRSTIRELLQLSPAERARIAIDEARNLERIPLGPPR